MMWFKWRRGSSQINSLVDGELNRYSLAEIYELEWSRTWKVGGSVWWCNGGGGPVELVRG